MGQQGEGDAPVKLTYDRSQENEDDTTKQT